jgi:nitrite reductase/ring-hydroxylating ferredoxin subunit
MRRPVDRYINTLLRRRRPRPFRPSDDDIAVARAAIDLMAAGSEGQAPSPRFVDDLRRRIAANDLANDTGMARPRILDWLRRRRRPSMPTWQMAYGRRRRQLLAAGALTATGAATGVAGAIAERILTGPAATTAQPADQTPGEILPTTGSWQTVAASADLAEGSVLSFDLGSVAGFVRRTAGRVEAVSGICTHQGCRLALDSPREKLVCPCHGATFAVNGMPLTHPYRMKQSLPALPSLAVREHEGHIQIYAPTA